MARDKVSNNFFKDFKVFDGLDNSRFFHFIWQVYPVIVVGLTLYLIKGKLLKLGLFEISYYDFFILVGLTIPWISHFACMPLYVKIGNHLYDNNRPKIAQTLMEHIPGIWAVATCFIILLGILVGKIMQWPQRIIVMYIISCSLHILFSQVMVYGQLLKKWSPWVFSWTLYGLVLYLFPLHWYLPPIMGFSTKILYLFFKTKKVPVPKWDWDFFVWMNVGLFLGLILWADKFILYLLGQNNISVGLMFSSLVPAVFILNFFFVFKSPAIEKSLTETIEAISKKRMNQYVHLMDQTYVLIKKTLLEIVVFSIFINFLVLILLHHFSSWGIDHSLYVFMLSFLLTFTSIVFNLLIVLRKYFILVLFSIIYFGILGVMLFLKMEIYDPNLIGVLFVLDTLLLFKLLNLWKSPHQLVLGV